MNGVTAENIRQLVARLYKSESRRILATLIRLLGDFDRAEDALQEAFGSALVQWEQEGVPDNPRAWLVSTGRFKAIDRMRRNAQFETRLDPAADQIADESPVDIEMLDDAIADDRLRLIFTCCHPALAPESRIALTLREVCGLTTEEIARVSFQRALELVKQEPERRLIERKLRTLQDS